MFYLPFATDWEHEEGQLQKIKWHVETGSCSEPPLHAHTGFLGFKYTHYQIPYFPKQPKAKPREDAQGDSAEGVNT